MNSFPGSPRLLKGGLVLLDPETSALRQIISLQYNPDSVSRTLQVQGTGESGDRSEPLRITAPPVENIKVDAEVDLTDQLEFPDQNRTAVEQGLYPYLATLETIIYPTSGQLQTNQSLSMAGRHISPTYGAIAKNVGRHIAQGVYRGMRKASD